MKGRSPFNNPRRRKTDIYQLIIQAGGEARWKTLKAHLQELRLGPTTLKKTLDEMVREKSLTKEARLGSDGAEVWYKISIFHEILDDFLNSLDGRILGTNFEKISQDIKCESSKLSGKEKDDYLYAQMQQAVQTASEAYISLFAPYVRGVLCADDRARVDQTFDYFLKDLFIDITKKSLGILSDYPTASIRAINNFTIKDKSELESAMEEEEYRAAEIQAKKQKEKKS